MKNILAADIGGTNSRFGHFIADDRGNLSLAQSIWLPTANADSFPALVKQLRASSFSLTPERADIDVIAIAGPVEDGKRSSPPLIPWILDLSDAEKDFGFTRSLLINDFIAQAYACRSKIGEEAEKVLDGIRLRGYLISVIGAGTGLGKALLVPDENGNYTAFPSEGGHANFPFVTNRECEFLEFLMKERAERYITLNTVVSGRGLQHIHRFLTGDLMEPQDIVSRFSEYPETLSWIARFYGRICRNFVLDTLALGGLYIAGGVAAQAPEIVRHSAFKDEFRSSDTLSKILSDVPVFLISDANSGLWGAALLGQKMLQTNQD